MNAASGAVLFGPGNGDPALGRHGKPRFHLELRGHEGDYTRPMATAPGEVPCTGHIFLSHAGTDVQAAHEFVEILRRNGVDIWFDKDRLQPGDPWMAKLEEAIASASAMIVYIGRLGIQAWVDREVRLGLVRNTHDREAFRLIPVLGEGADPANLPPFLQQQQYVDLRDRQHAPQQIRRLVEMLPKPSQSQAAISTEYWTNHSPFRSLRIFGPEDSWLFFGRDRDTSELLARLGRKPALAVIGNSGGGKSSLIQAGLIPALRRGRFQHPWQGCRLVANRPVPTVCFALR
jgi:hypothetical protein